MKINFHIYKKINKIHKLMIQIANLLKNNKMLAIKICRK